MKRIKVAVVGLGYWGPNLLRNFHGHKGFEVVYGCDLLEENLLRVKADYPFLKLTKRFDELLNDKELDLIAIATPPETHYALGKETLESGKNLWIEKPFTTSFQKAKKLFDLAKKKNLYIHVDLPFIFHPPVQKIKEIIEKKQIGKPYYYTSLRTNLGLIQKEVDVVWDLAPHDLSILFYLFPNYAIKRIEMSGSVHLENHNKKEIANLVIHFSNGFTAYIYLSWLSPVKIRLITIGGSKKMILFDDVEPTEKIKIYDKGVEITKTEVSPFFPVYRQGDVVIPYFENKEALYEEVDFLHKELLKPKRDYFTAEIGLKILKVIDK